MRDEDLVAGDVEGGDVLAEARRRRSTAGSVGVEVAEVAGEQVDGQLALRQRQAEADDVVELVAASR